MCVEDFEKDQHDEVDLKVGDPVIVLNMKILTGGLEE